MPNSFGRDIIPANEESRLGALRRYQLIKDLPEKYFTNLARIIATTFNSPIALVSLVDQDEVTFPGNFGMQGTERVPRGISLCSLAVLSDQPTVFEDALDEPCLLANPLVAGEFGLRFYAGAPIVTSDGYAIGTVCIVDKQPRPFSTEEQEMLQEFSKSVIKDLDMRLQLIKAE